MKKAVLYIHGRGGNAGEAGHYTDLFPGYDVVGFDYKSDTPWECRSEFKEKIKELKYKYGGVILVANSIGAFFAMNAFDETDIEKAFFISPVIDMEKLICDMMSRAHVSEERLRCIGTAETGDGTVLSWEYLCYVRQNPPEWNVRTAVLYGENDFITSYETVRDFTASHNFELTVMKGGEHWFHTDAQMRFLDEWIKRYV